MILQLTRTDRSDNGTFGEIEDSDGFFVCYTCERPDNGNKPMGCIPLGNYLAVPFNSPSKGKDFLLRNVPDRSMIEIHVGNTVQNTDGCILVGDSTGTIEGAKAVLNSKATLKHMLEQYPNGFELQIVNAEEQTVD